MSNDGTLEVSFGSLSKRWLVSKQRAWRFIEFLKDSGVITIGRKADDSRTKSGRTIICLSSEYVSIADEKRTKSGRIEDENQKIKTEEIKPKAEEPKEVKKPRRDRPNDVQEVRDYVQEKGYHFNPDEFYAFYESSNWHRGKTKITNWKQCCVTWETTWKKGRNDFEEANKKVLEDNPPMGKGSYGAVIHYIAEHSENIVKGVPLPTEAEVAEISQNYKDFFIQAVKNMDADPNLSKKTFWGAFVNAIQLTKRTIDYGTQQLAREESARNKRDEQLRAFQAARDNTPDSGAFFGDY